MKDGPRFLSGARILVAVVTLLGLLAWMLIMGPGLFEPGGAQLAGQSPDARRCHQSRPAGA